MKNLDKLVARWEAEIHEHLADYNDNVEGEFSLEEFAEQTGLPIQRAYVFIMNLEDDDVMQDIACGDYESFDCLDRGQFNDGYVDMISDMISNGDEDRWDDEDTTDEEIHTDHGAEIEMVKNADGSWSKKPREVNENTPVEYAVAVLQEEILKVQREDSANQWAQTKMKELQNAMQILMNHGK